MKMEDLGVEVKQEPCDEENHPFMFVSCEIKEQSSDCEDESFLKSDIKDETEEHENNLNGNYYYNGVFIKQELHNDCTDETGSSNTLSRTLKTDILKCAKCNLSFLKQHFYDAHMEWHSNQEILTSKEENTPLESDIGLSDETKKPMKSGLLKCEICNLSFLKQHFYESHIQWHAGKKPYECHLCEKKFASASDLSTHLKTHSDKKKLFKCKICKKVFLVKAHFEFHMKKGHTVKKHTAKKHIIKKAHECDKCSENFISFEFLLQHKLSSHVNNSYDDFIEAKNVQEV